MPHTTRRARERAETRERIVEAALHVLETEGPSALTVRRIANDVEYSAPVVYQHFANKGALMAELVAHGHRLILAGFAHVAEEPDVERRLTRTASEYVRFAGDHPHLYALMNGTAVDAEARRHAAEAAIALLRELLTAWSATHAVPLPDLDEACEIIWGTLYGIASLGQLDTVGNERARRLAQQALQALLLGWRAEAGT